MRMQLPARGFRTGPTGFVLLPCGFALHAVLALQSGHVQLIGVGMAQRHPVEKQLLDVVQLRFTRLA